MALQLVRGRPDWSPASHTLNGSAFGEDPQFQPLRFFGPRLARGLPSFDSEGLTMRALIGLLSILAIVAAIATRAIYFSSDAQRASVTFDKQRAAEVIRDAKDAGREAAQRLDNAIQNSRSEPVSANPAHPN